MILRGLLGRLFLGLKGKSRQGYFHTYICTLGYEDKLPKYCISMNKTEKMLRMTEKRCRTQVLEDCILELSKPGFSLSIPISLC